MRAMPEPPRSLRIQGWLRSAGIFLIGLSSVVGLGVIGFMANLADDSLQLARENKAESDCRAQLFNAVSSLQGEINSRGWSILIERFFDTIDEERLRSEADQLNALVLQWRDAQDRRDRVEEICNQEQ